jgi:hypothetical protein
MAQMNTELQIPQESNLPKARTGVELACEYERIQREAGSIEAREWVICLPKAEWWALMEARRTKVSK